MSWFETDDLELPISPNFKGRDFYILNLEGGMDRQTQTIGLKPTHAA
jgi:hypothetical protein